MIRCFVFSLFAFAVLLSFGGDPVYYFASSPDGDWAGYAWDSSLSDIASSLFPDVPLSPAYTPNTLLSADGSFYLQLISPDDYFEQLEESPYIPFSSDPAYASSTPSVPPSGGGGSPSGGGGGEGGFDSVGFFGELPSFMSGLSSAVLSVLSVAAFVFLSFIAWRKFRYSSKRI